jgi:hypothetical protein
VDWSAAASSWAVILAYTGDTYVGDARTLVSNGPAYDFAAQASPFLPALGVSGADRLVIVASHKNKTSTSDDATTITAPGSFTKRAQLLQTGAGTNIVAAVADWQQTTATDFDGTDFTIDGTAESLSSVGIAFAIRTRGAVSTIIPDVVTENVRTDTTSPQTFSHAGAASGVKGVALMITHGTSSTDHVTAASYGGVAMTRIQRNTDTATEPGAAEIWFLGKGIPQGTQTVSYTCGATTDDIHAVCATFLANRDMGVFDSDGVSEQATDPSVTLQVGGRESIAIGALYSGLASGVNFVENAECSRISDHDYGAFMSFVFRQANSSTADIAIGGTSVTDDVAFSAAAFGGIAPVTLLVATADTGTTPNTSGAYTPTAGSLQVVVTAARTTTDTAPTLSNSTGLTFTRGSTVATFPTVVGNALAVFVANALTSNVSSQTVTLSHAGDEAAGSVIAVLEVTGMTKTGSAAILKIGADNDRGAGNTLAMAMGGAVITGNPTIAAAINSSNPAALTAPSGWTELVDTGFATPNGGLQVSSRDSGFTGSTITYGSALADNGAGLAIELDASGGVAALANYHNSLRAL